MPCRVEKCARPTFARCAKCGLEVCGGHAEDCDGCDKTFCSTCYKQHVREEESC
jgi:hypothetical protein